METSTRTPEEIDEAAIRIDRFVGFVQDIIEDPSTLDRLPESAAIDVTPIAEKEPGKEYLADTRRFAISEARENVRGQRPSTGHH